VLPPLLVFLAVGVIGREFHELDLPYAILIDDPDQDAVVKHGVHFGHLPDARDGLLGVLGVVNDMERGGAVPAGEMVLLVHVDIVRPAPDVVRSRSSSVIQLPLPLGALAEHQAVMNSPLEIDNGKRVNVRRGDRHTVAAGHGSAWR